MSAELLRAVSEQGYADATPIQIQAIPLVLAGRDIMAGAQTGTGKTASFALPLLQRLGAPSGSHPRALILTPTRELTAQVEESIRVYGKYLSLRSVAIYGGVSLAPQTKALRTGVDIVVATPGRLLDHVQQGGVDFSQIEILILDEADRMLDLGFIRDIRRILDLLPAKRQNLLFSATFSDEVQELAAAFMHEPEVVQAATRNAPSDLVAQVVHPVDANRKRELLAHLISSGNWQQVLVFTRTKHGANRLAQQLARDGIEADAIHGNKSQSRRTRSLAEFKNGTLRVLVATDIAARGLDIEELPHVVNYDLPHVAEDYVHRIGRTGRAGSQGEAVSLVCAEDQGLMTSIERLLKRRVERRVIEGFEVRAGAQSAEPGDEQPVVADPRPRRERGDTPRPPRERNARAPRPEPGQRPPAGNRQPAGNRHLAGARDGIGNRQPAAQRDSIGDRDGIGNRDSIGNREPAANRRTSGGRPPRQNRAVGENSWNTNRHANRPDFAAQEEPEFEIDGNRAMPEPEIEEVDGNRFYPEPAPKAIGGEPRRGMRNNAQGQAQPFGRDGQGQPRRRDGQGPQRNPQGQPAGRDGRRQSGPRNGQGQPFARGPKGQRSPGDAQDQRSFGNSQGQTSFRNPQGQSAGPNPQGQQGQRRRGQENGGRASGNRGRSWSGPSGFGNSSRGR